MARGLRRGARLLIEGYVNGARRPSRVGLLNLAEGGGARAVQLVLDDLAEAGAFYELHSGVARPVEFVSGEAGGCDAFEPCAANGCDAFVLGFYLDKAGEFAFAGQEVVDTLRGLPQDAVIYGLCCSAPFAAPAALHGLGQLEAACVESGHAWCGGMVVRCAGALPRLKNKPRMGMARRKVSEAADELLLAIRCGSHAGTVVSRPGLLWCMREAMRLA